MTKILIVEDDSAIIHVMEAFLLQAGYEVALAKNGLEAQKIFDRSQKEYHLIITDCMMPEIDGFTFLEKIRAKSKIPVLMITALTEEQDEIKGFEYGADEYIKKPFSYRVFLKRVEALLARTIKEDLSLKYQNIALNKEKHTVFVNEKAVFLTKKEFDILELLLKNQQKVVSHETIVDQVWGYDIAVDTAILNSHIKNLRQKLQTNSITTIRGAGYKLE